MGKRVSAPTIKVRGLKQAVGLLLLSAAVIIGIFYVPVTIDGITYNSYLGHRVLKVDDDLEKAVVRPGTRKIDKAFANHKRLTAVVLPDSIKKIPIAAFENCTALQSAELPAGLETIGGAAFQGCSRLVCPSGWFGIQHVRADRRERPIPSGPPPSLTLGRSQDGLAQTIRISSKNDPSSCLKDPPERQFRSGADAAESRPKTQPVQRRPGP